MVERSHAWFNPAHRLPVRYERRANIDEASALPWASLITLNQIKRFCGAPVAHRLHWRLDTQSPEGLIERYPCELAPPPHQGGAARDIGMPNDDPEAIRQNMAS